MNLDVLFDAANLFVLPFWALMILLPRWQVTQRIMTSFVPFVVLAGLYAYLFATSVTPDSAQDFSNPQLTDLARLFSDERVMATGWVHFLVMDLFVGRWIYLEGQQQPQLWIRHSLILCLFAGPLGLLSHIITRGITFRFFSPDKTDAVEGRNDPTPAVSEQEPV